MKRAGSVLAGVRCICPAVPCGSSIESAYVCRTGSWQGSCSPVCVAWPLLSQVPLTRRLHVCAAQSSSGLVLVTVRCMCCAVIGACCKDAADLL